MCVNFQRLSSFCLIFSNLSCFCTFTCSAFSFVRVCWHLDKVSLNANENVQCFVAKNATKPKQAWSRIWCDKVRVTWWYKYSKFLTTSKLLCICTFRRQANISEKLTVHRFTRIIFVHNLTTVFLHLPKSNKFGSVRGWREIFPDPDWPRVTVSHTLTGVTELIKRLVI